MVPIDQVAAAVGLQKSDLYELGEDAPQRIRDIVKKLKGNVLGFLAIEERKYFVDRSMPIPRQRFTEGHEIGHDALPWHQAAFWGEDKTTIDPATKETLEIEANQFAAELLFGAGRFTNQADQYAPGLEIALYLAAEYGVSVHAAIRKYVEDSKHPIAVLALGRYPSHTGGVRRFDGQTFESEKFEEKYGRLTALMHSSIGSTTYPELPALLKLQTGRAPACDVKLDTARGSVTFTAEGFTNGRLNFIVLHKPSRLRGQKFRLISASGFELLPAG
ncbi:ImmA/IrrE family metallo-endopeptidase [Lacisediminihabitans sp. H27-G8]|uniref:ImmA/IrrE family metallo-endopeptidase n=1 Tax=Lacisediminihabitans sp. H27-G8 TaxID=3111909 RepID=UPI0038FCDC3F